MSVRIAVGGDAGEAVDRIVPRLVRERVASGIAAQDPDLWGPTAVPDAAPRLGWTEAVADSRPLVAEIAELRERLLADGVERVVLCGAGGAAIAGQVIAATQTVPLSVLDAADDGVIAAVAADQPASTAAVVLAERGTEAETARYLAAFESAFRNAGVDPAARIVVVAEADSPAAEDARATGRRVFAGEPGAGAAYSALTAFGLVPAGLAGADLGELLDEAESELLDLAADQPTNNALVLGAAIAGADPRREVLLVVADGTHVAGLGDWVAQLLSATTAGSGTGLVPVVAERTAPELAAAAPGVQVVRLVDEATDDRYDPLLADGEILLSGSLGELLLVWEVAAAVAARLLGVDPFDRSTVDAVEARAAALLARPAGAGPAFEPHGLPAGGADPVGDLLAAVPDDGWTAIVVHGDPALAAALVARRDALARRTGRPVLVDRGPRSIHSTARVRLDGPGNGAHLVVLAQQDDGGDLVRAQGEAEAAALAERGGPVVVARVAGADGAAALLAAVDA